MSFCTVCGKEMSGRDAQWSAICGSCYRLGAPEDPPRTAYDKPLRPRNPNETNDTRRRRRALESGMQDRSVTEREDHS